MPLKTNEIKSNKEIVDYTTEDENMIDIFIEILCFSELILINIGLNMSSVNLLLTN